MTDLRIDRSVPPEGTPDAQDRSGDVDLRISLVGPAVANGQINAGTFGSALVSLARLIERISEIATGARLSPRVSDRFERGSFVFTVTPPHNVGETLQWLATVKVMLDLIGVPTGKDGGLR